MAHAGPSRGAILRLVSQRIGVMYLGRIVEPTPTAALFPTPQHPYTQALLAAIPEPIPGRKRHRRLLEGELPSPESPPKGCAFHPRCPRAKERCKAELPAVAGDESGQLVRCRFPGGGGLSGDASPFHQP